MKVKLAAVIPTVQYGNIQPEFEVEADSIPLGLAMIEPHIRAMWKKYSEKPLPSEENNRKLIKAFSGGEIYYDAEAHVYTNEQGEVYLSGSQYADTFRKPFDKQRIAEAMAKKIDADPQDIIKMWELKSQASMDFGNSIHRALQLYEQYDGLATKLNKETHRHDSPTIKMIVDSFLESHQGERVISEALIVDHAARRAGQVDRLLVTSRKTGVICDLKTDTDIQKNLPTHWNQLSFYAAILVANGWEITGLRVHHWDGSKWVDYDHEVNVI